MDIQISFFPLQHEARCSLKSLCDFLTRSSNLLSASPTCSFLISRPCLLLVGPYLHSQHLYLIHHTSNKWNRIQAWSISNTFLWFFYSSIFLFFKKVELWSVPWVLVGSPEPSPGIVVDTGTCVHLAHGDSKVEEYQCSHARPAPMSKWFLVNIHVH